MRSMVGGTLKESWVPHDTRDEVVDYVRRWHERTEIPARQFVGWLGIGSGLNCMMLGVEW